MKRIVPFFLLLVIFFSGLFAQAPVMFNYQAMLRDDAGQPIVSEEITLHIAILAGDPEGEMVFEEVHHTGTNEMGLVNIAVGSVEELGDVSWGDDAYFMSVTVDGSLMGVSQLLSVPYAMHALQSADSFSGDYEDLENKPDLDAFVFVEEVQPGDMLYYGGEEWKRIPVGDEGQVLQIVQGTPQWADIADHAGSVTDIDGNVYATIIVDGVEWMAENLRTTRYVDGTHIPSGLDSDDWSSTTSGAFTVYDPDNVDDIDTQGEMVDLYGKLYNWYAVDDERNLCPEGWHVPTADQWDALSDHLIDTYDDVYAFNVGNALKSCRQVGSPLGGECDTDEHPRWDAHDTEYGIDLVGFSAFAAGSRNFLGNYFNLANFAFFWTSSENPPEGNVTYRRLVRDSGEVQDISTSENAGFSVRCVKVDER